MKTPIGPSLPGAPNVPRSAPAAQSPDNSLRDTMFTLHVSMSSIVANNILFNFGECLKSSLHYLLSNINNLVIRSHVNQSCCSRYVVETVLCQRAVRDITI